MTPSTPLPHRGTLTVSIGPPRRRVATVLLSLRRRLALLRACALLTVLALIPDPAWSEGVDCDVVDGQVQVMLEVGALIDTVNIIVGTTTLDAAPPFYLLEIPTGSTIEETIGDLLGTLLVAVAEPAFRSTTPEAERQKTVAAVGGTVDDFEDQAFLERIQAALLHTRSTGAGVTIALVDSGVLATHEAFNGAALELGPDYVDDDADPTEIANGLDDDDDGDVDEGFGHGTMVAGLAHVMAPDATLRITRVLDDEGHGTVFDVVKAIDDAIDADVDVINLSLGLSCESGVLAEAVERAAAAGITLVAAAGNDSRELPPVFPAADPHTLSVTAVDSVDVKAWFANYHVSVDVAAPGDGLLVPYADGTYAICAGTSFAAPLVAGQAAIVRALDPAASKTEVDALCRDGVVDIYDIPENAPYLERLGEGRLDGAATLAALGLVLGIPTDILPVVTLTDHTPNPLPAGAPVSLRVREGVGAIAIFDAAGRRLTRLSVPTGGLVHWNGHDARDRPVGPGVVFVQGQGTDRTALRIVRY